MSEIGLKAMIFKNKWLEYILEIIVGILITSVDTAVLVVKLNSTSNGLKFRKYLIVNQFRQWGDFFKKDSLYRQYVNI